MSLFGTDGIRNRVGNYPFTSESLPRLGRAIAVWAEEKYGKNVSFLLVRDTRYSGPWIKSGLMSGLLRHPVTVYDAGVLPTPAVFHLMKTDSRFTCGIIISASHNPAEDNGIKLVDSVTGKLTRADEERISALLQVQEKECSFDTLGQEIALHNAHKHYENKLINLFSSLSGTSKKIVIDCANGATSVCAQTIFESLGYSVIALHSSPDGYNINKDCGATHVDSLQKAVIEHKAFIGFAFDGDGDRVIAVNSFGTIKDGDDILALLMTHSSYNGGPALVSTAMANQGLEALMHSLGKNLIRTAIGDKYVLEAMNEHNLLLGGEPSGHIILKDIISTGDGILVALKLLETLEQTNNHLFTTFSKFPQVLINVPIKQKMDLTLPPLSNLIEEGKSRLHSGRLLVRYSGTESIVRVMVEDADSELTTSIAHTLAQQLEAVLS